MAFRKITAVAIIMTTLAMTPALADITEARNFYQFEPTVLTSGQPNATQLAEAADDGIEVVINLVPESEGIYNPEEGEILAAQGVEYIHVPVSWRDPKAEEFQTFLNAMDRVGDRKVLVHCWANARASALVAAHRVIRAPDIQAAELEQLETIWRDVAGYDFARDTVWQDYLADNIAGAEQ
ncbi:protein tyrosine phosphatase family protein [uncultured Litoreibacter sp.]|uniref:protein tyrosine phosphatase family protein n=1 Tax=uncultured Litoreibacter sp. TaxID=1392394 RepID=UPI00261311AB|nr:protein tyrosine phosphatase family protein [uncultured Litoreibacter sp.]